MMMRHFVGFVWYLNGAEIVIRKNFIVFYNFNFIYFQSIVKFYFVEVYPRELLAGFNFVWYCELCKIRIFVQWNTLWTALSSLNWQGLPLTEVYLGVIDLILYFIMIIFYLDFMKALEGLKSLPLFIYFIYFMIFGMIDDYFMIFYCVCVAMEPVIPKPLNIEMRISLIECSLISCYRSMKCWINPQGGELIIIYLIFFIDTSEKAAAAIYFISFIGISIILSFGLIFLFCDLGFGLPAITPSFYLVVFTVLDGLNSLQQYFNLFYFCSVILTFFILFSWCSPGFV